MFKFAVTLLIGAFAIANALPLPSSDKKYLVFTNEVTFLEALVSCKTYGYHLATVLNDEENLLLNSTVPLSDSSHYWLGGVHSVNDIFINEWIWLETANDVLYRNWDDGQPIIENGINCVVLYGNGKWISHACENYKFGFVCELS